MAVDNERSFIGGFDKLISIVVPPKKERWILDSGASLNFINDLSLLRDIRSSNRDIEVGSGEKLKATHVGTIFFTTSSPSDSSTVYILREVTYCPGICINAMSARLISWGELGYINSQGQPMFPTEGDISVIFNCNMSWIFSSERKQAILTAPFDPSINQYSPQISIIPPGAPLDKTLPSPAALLLASADKNFHLKQLILQYHHRLGHIGLSTIQDIARKNDTMPHELKNIKGVLSELPVCHACAMGRQKDQSFARSNFKTSKCLEVVYIDITGPARIASFDKMLYTIVLLDDHSRFIWVYFTESRKKEVLTPIIKAFLNITGPNGEKTIKFHCDNEFNFEWFTDICTEYQVRYSFSQPYTPQHNSRVERVMSSIKAPARAMLGASYLPLPFWKFAICASVYVKNRVPHRATGKSPYEVFYGKAPNLNYLRTFGCLCFPFTPNSQRQALEINAPYDTRSRLGVFIGYDQHNKGYTIFLPHEAKIISAAHVVFDERSYWKWDKKGIEDRKTWQAYDLWAEDDYERIDRLMAEQGKEEQDGGGSRWLQDLPLAEMERLASESAEHVQQEIEVHDEFNKRIEEVETSRQAEKVRKDQEEAEKSLVEEEQLREWTERENQRQYGEIIENAKAIENAKVQETVARTQTNHVESDSDSDDEHRAVARPITISSKVQQATAQADQPVVANDDTVMEVEDSRNDNDEDAGKADNGKNDGEEKNGNSEAVAEGGGEADSDGGYDDAVEEIEGNDENREDVREEGETEEEEREAEKAEVERMEAERVEAARVEAERMEAEKVEAARVEAEKMEADRRVAADLKEAKRLMREEENRIAASQKKIVIAARQQAILDGKERVEKEKLAKEREKAREKSWKAFIEADAEIDICVESEEEELAQMLHLIDAIDKMPHDIYFRDDTLSSPDGFLASLAAVFTSRQPASRATIEGAPSSMSQVRRRADWPEWEKAMREEWDALNKSETFEVYNELPEGKNLVGCKWVLTVKVDIQGNPIRHKARLVGQGYNQVHGIDFEETFSPVIKLTALRTFLAIAIIKGYRVKLMDVKTAYLNAENEHEIYMTFPIDFRDESKPKQVLRVIKSLYGLKASGREWYKTLCSRLIAAGFRQTQYDDCVFIHGDTNAILLTYVDDLVLLSPDQEVEDNIANLLRSQFTMTDCPPDAAFLGIAIQPLTDGRRGYSMSQEFYINTILERFDISSKPVAKTPLDKAKASALTQSPSEYIADPDERSEYLSKIGCLLWVAQATRPDISFAVSKLARFSYNPSPNHHEHVDTVFRYLKNTKRHALELEIDAATDHDTPLSLTAYSDADFGGDRDKGRSTTGYVVLLNRMIIDWKSQLQSTVARSTTDAEFIALSDTAKQVIGLRNLIDDIFEGNDKRAITIFTDSNTARQLAQPFANHSAVKHLRAKEQYVREAVSEAYIKLERVKTNQNTADKLTKASSPSDINEFCISMNIRRMKVGDGSIEDHDKRESSGGQ